MKKNEINIALISISNNAYSETFIHAHKSFLEGNIYYYYGSPFPTHLENKGLLQNSRLKRILYILKGKFQLNTRSLEEVAILKSFRENKINVIFAEYGDVAERILPISKELGLPLIVHFHGYDASKKSILQRHNYYKNLFGQAHSVIAVSKKMYNDFLNWQCPEEKLVYNPCGPNEEFYKIRPTFNKLQFLSIGRFVDKKAPYYILLSFYQIVAKYPECRLVMAGEGELWETCKNLSSKLNLQRNVKFVGVLSPEGVREYLAQSFCFLQHSITTESGDSEGTPVGILEASAAGLPVISTRHAGISDVIIEGETGFLVDEHDVDEMARRMMDLIENPSEAIRMGNKGRDFIRENFPISKHIDCLNSLIRNAKDSQ